MAIRVLMLLTNCFDPDPRVYNEAKTLVDHDYKVTIIGWDRDHKRPKQQDYQGIKVERIYLRSTHGRGTSQVPFLLVFWILVLFKMLREDFDIVHCHDLDTLPLGMVLAKLRGKKIIFDAHESFTDMLGSNVLKPLKRVLRFLEDLLIKRLDALITVGQLLRQEYQRRGAKNTFVVGNWKKLEDYSFPVERKEELREKLHIAPDKLVITYIAWLSEERKLPALLDAVEAHGELFLLIGGDGPLRGEVERRSASKDNIHYLGYVDPSEVPLYTSLADVIYYGFDGKNPNSRYSAPNKLFEALAAGKAVVTGEFGEIGRIVKAEDCGLCLPSLNPGDLGEVFAKLRQRDVLGKYQANALRAAKETYNWNKAAIKLLQVYKQVEFGWQR